MWNRLGSSSIKASILVTMEAFSIMASMFPILESPAAFSLPVASTCREIPSSWEVLRVITEVKATMFRLLNRTENRMMIRLNTD